MVRMLPADNLSFALLTLVYPIETSNLVSTLISLRATVGEEEAIQPIGSEFSQFAGIFNSCSTSKI